MLDNINIENILFLDIETVPQYPEYIFLPQRMKKLWDKKAEIIAKNNESPAEIYSKAGIYSEFGKIIVISFAYIRTYNGKKTLIVKSIYDQDEKKILSVFNKLLSTYFYSKEHYLCAHNGKEFDFPYIARRSIINNIKVADILYTPGAKPWEIKHLDTLELWKFGDYKNWTSLDLLTAVFNIPSPKDDINGSDVYRVYWKEKNLDKIQNYCRQDVIALVQVFLRLNQKTIIDDDKIIHK